MKIQVSEKNGSFDLAYINERNYVSFSSLKNLRDGISPNFNPDASFFKFGSELHSRFLEKKKIETLSEDDESLLYNMLNKLNETRMVTSLMKKAKVEVEIRTTVQGVPILGYLDIFKDRKYIADLKTTQTNTMKAFVNSLDFMQAALYQEATGIDDFYYIGICKKSPHDVMVFNVNSYPEILNESKNELKQLLSYVKKHSEFTK